MNEFNSLRKIAQAAKERLQQTSIEKKIQKTQSKKNISSALAYKTLYINNYKTIAYNDDDEEFYNKVRVLLDNNYDCPNIINQLIDYSIYNKLDDDLKIKYVLNISTRFIQCKQKYDTTQSKYANLENIK